MDQQRVASSVPFSSSRPWRSGPSTLLCRRRTLSLAQMHGVSSPAADGPALPAYS